MAPPLIQLKDIKLTFGGTPLLSGVELSVSTGERVCLIGRNGTGKTTLMRLISGEQVPDSGELQFRNDIVISQLEQDLPQDVGHTVRAVVASGLSQASSVFL